MLRKISGLLTVAAVALIGFSVTAPNPAHARSTCHFRADNGFSWIIHTTATARRMRTACRRAERRCNRKLRRARNRREIPRGRVTPSCRRIGTASCQTC